MRNFAIPFLTLILVVTGVAAAQTAHAQPFPSNDCTTGFTCPNGQSCDIVTHQCSASLAPSGNASTQLQPNSLQTRPGPNATNITLINPLNSGGCTPNGDCLMVFLLKILSFIIRIGSIAVIVMLVYVGYLFVVAQGEPGKISEARSALLWTVIGALVLLGSQAIAYGIQATVQALSVGQ